MVFVLYRWFWYEGIRICFVTSTFVQHGQSRHGFRLKTPDPLDGCLRSTLICLYLSFAEVGEWF